MNITLLKNFYSAKEIAFELGLSTTVIFMKIKVMEIEPDLLVNGVMHFSKISKDRLSGKYNFEEENTILSDEVEYITLESSMNG
jgi:hypothetical protein